MCHVAKCGSRDLCLSVDRFCQCDNVAALQGRVNKLYWCVVQIKMKAKSDDGRGLSKGAGSRGIGIKEGAIGPRLYAPCFTKLNRCVVESQ